MHHRFLGTQFSYTVSRIGPHRFLGDPGLHVFWAIPEREAAQWIMLTRAPDAVSELSFPVSLFLTAGCAALV
jgi:hypothetical protein